MTSRNREHLSLVEPPLSSNLIRFPTRENHSFDLVGFQPLHTCVEDVLQSLQARNFAQLYLTGPDHYKIMRKIFELTRGTLRVLGKPIPKFELTVDQIEDEGAFYTLYPHVGGDIRRFRPRVQSDQSTPVQYSGKLVSLSQYRKRAAQPSPIRK